MHLGFSERCLFLAYAFAIVTEIFELDSGNVKALCYRVRYCDFRVHVDEPSLHLGHFHFTNLV